MSPACLPPVEAVASPPMFTHLTIYGNRYAQVLESRTVKLLRGVNRVQLDGIATRYIPDSISLVGSNGPIPGRAEGEGKVTYRTATFRPARSTPEQMLADSIGTEIRVYQKTGAAGWLKGKLLSVVGDRLALELPGGECRMMNTSDVELPKVPEGLTASLVVELDVGTPGEYLLTFMYETTDLGWSAKHTLVLDEANNQIELWRTTVAISNNAGIRYKNAIVRLMSDTVVRGGSTAGFEKSLHPASMEGAASVESVGDQTEYRLTERVDLEDMKLCQVVLFEQRNVPVEREYFITPQSWYSNKQIPASVRLIVENTEKANMGQQLPAGPVKVFQRNLEGVQQRIGGAHLPETACNEKMALVIGTTANIKFTQTLVESKRFDQRGNLVTRTGGQVPPPPSTPTVGVQTVVGEPVVEEQTWEVKIYNYSKTRQVQVKVELMLLGDQFVEKPFVRINAQQAEAKLMVPAGGEKSARYTYRNDLK